ncbi:MAG: hypothetical protein AAGG08_08645, partial [Actinomycetota bacterium]
MFGTPLRSQAGRPARLVPARLRPARLRPARLAGLVALGLATIVSAGPSPVGATPADNDAPSRVPDAVTPTTAEEVEEIPVLGIDSIELGFEQLPAPNVPQGCEGLAFSPQFAVAPCTIQSSLNAVPVGSFVIEEITIATGPRTGPMRIDVVEAIRSRALGPNGQPAPAACCFQRASTPAFTLPPNAASTIDLELPVKSEIIDIDGEPVEVFQYLALTLLDFNSSLPILARPDLPILGQLGQPDANGLRTQGGTFFNAIPTMSITACNVDGSSPEAICQQSSGPGQGGPGNSGTSLSGIAPDRLLDTHESGGRVGAGSTTRVRVAGVDGVPAGAVGAVLNVTAVQPVGPG